MSTLDRGGFHFQDHEAIDDTRFLCRDFVSAEKLRNATVHDQNWIKGRQAGASGE
jgi:hypothetical protein